MYYLRPSRPESFTKTTMWADTLFTATRLFIIVDNVTIHFFGKPRTILLRWKQDFNKVTSCFVRSAKSTFLLCLCNGRFINCRLCLLNNVLFWPHLDTCTCRLVYMYTCMHDRAIKHFSCIDWYLIHLCCSDFLTPRIHVVCACKLAMCHAQN